MSAAPSEMPHWACFLRRGDAETHHWPFGVEERAALISRYLRPEPRIPLREALLACASAAMDISDGLAIDATRLCAASGVSGRIETAKVPLSGPAQSVLLADPGALETILTGGDDYEILAAVPPGRDRAFAASAEAAGIAVTRIGVVGQGTDPLSIIGGDGRAPHLIPPRLRSSGPLTSRR